jgi:hypothetical protein
MISTGVGRLSVGRHAADATRATTATGHGGQGGVKRRAVVELQWLDRGGRFRHVVFRAPRFRRLLATVGIVTVLGLVVGGGLVLVSQRFPALDRIDAILCENRTMRERQEALREQAFDLAEQLYWHVEQQHGTARLADSPGRTREDECPRPPARDASNEAILDWLSEHGALLEALAREPVAGRSQTDGRQASDQATATRGTAPAADGARLQVARMGSNE